MLEVEAKVRVPSFEPIRERLQQLGATCLGSATESDQFFQHPGRDFRTTDEALRLRNVDGALELTYKGPNQSETLKTRVEHNLPLSSDPTQLLEALGFVPAATVEKNRETWKLDGLTISLDSLACGTFVEVEALGKHAGGATAQVEAGLKLLGLESEQRIAESYLSLLERHRA